MFISFISYVVLLYTIFIINNLMNKSGLKIGLLDAACQHQCYISVSLVDINAISLVNLVDINAISLYVLSMLNISVTLCHDLLSEISY